MSGTVDTPYLGSRISLISKAKIRYEGILYAIDTENMTVALTKVRSFGTEDRNPERPVPPRDETFGNLFIIRYGRGSVWKCVGVTAGITSYHSYTCLERGRRWFKPSISQTLFSRVNDLDRFILMIRVKFKVN